VLKPTCLRLTSPRQPIQPESVIPKPREAGARFLQRRGPQHARFLFVRVMGWRVKHFPTRARPLSGRKRSKAWRREEKLRLILAANPDWADMTTPSTQKPRVPGTPAERGVGRRSNAGRLFRKPSSARYCAGSHVKAENCGSRFLRATATPSVQHRPAWGPRYSHAEESACSLYGRRDDDLLKTRGL
jgi:predicted GIY-YIG superfamily endonuclease